MIRFNPNNCLSCLSCMTIEKCNDYLDAKRTGRPYFKEEPNCTNCTECIDMCTAFTKY